MALPGYGVYDTEAQDIENRRRYAEALQAQGAQPLQGHMAGRVYAAPSWTQGLAKVLQSYVGAKGAQDATDERKALGVKYQTGMIKTLEDAMRAGAGTPAQAGNSDVMQSNKSLDEFDPTPATAAVAPDRMKMAQILMQHPGTQQMGMQQMSADMQRQALISALGGAGGPQGAPAPQGGQPQPMAPGAQPQPAGGQPRAQLGGPAGGIPMAVWLQVDSTGKAYMAQFAKDQTEGATLDLKERTLQQTIAEFNGLSANQRAVLQNQGINTAIDLAKARDQGLNVQIPGMPGQQPGQGAPGMPAMPQGQPPQVPQGPQMSPGMQIPPEVQAQRDAEAAAIQQREQTGGGIPTASVIPGSTAGVQQGQPAMQQGGHKPIPMPVGLSPAKAREYIAKMETSRPHDLNSLENSVASIDQAVEQAKAVLKHPGLKMATGRTSLLATSNLLSQDAYDAKQKLDTLSGQILLSVLSSLKQVSPNGSSGFGALNKSEGDAIRNSIASLENAQSYEQVREAVQTVENNLKSSRDRLTRGFERLYGEAPQIKSYTNIPKKEGEVPDGVDAKLWAVMTPEERKAWQ